MSGELAHDPWFGALARALAPRAHVPFAGTPPLVREVGWLEVSFRLDRLPPEDRRALEAMRALARPGATDAARSRSLAGERSESAATARTSGDVPAAARPRDERAVVACPRFAVADLARGSEAARVLLAAHDAATAPARAPRIMGVVNVTPDSFSDGGAHADAAAAIEHGRALSAQGAAILDVGGESTRPGA